MWGYLRKSIKVSNIKKGKRERTQWRPTEIIVVDRQKEGKINKNWIKMNVVLNMEKRGGKIES